MASWPPRVFGSCVIRSMVQVCPARVGDVIGISRPGVDRWLGLLR
jgi:hypothetical protein